MSLAPGPRLGPYEILSPLGAGGMGEVYKARDTRLGREVAVKVLPADFAQDAERLHRFEQEARATAALDHPNILSVYDIGTHEGTPYIVEQLLEGESLRQRLRGGPLAPAKAVEIGVQIAQGLAAAHEKGIVHRDLKPENLFITKDGRIKILDFGLARLRLQEAPLEEGRSEAPTADSPTGEGKVLGTPSYMSPEQAQGQPVDIRSDVFSLGIVLFEMATGHRPFEGKTSLSVISAILRDKPASITTVQPAAPSRLDRIVTRCLEKDPAARYPDASAILEDLKRLAAEISPDSRGLFLLRRLSPRWVKTGYVIVAVAAALGGSLWYRHNARQRWVRQVALPRLEEIVERLRAGGEGRAGWDAFVLTREIEAAAPGDPLVERLKQKFMTDFSITSDPPGATVGMRYYEEPDAAPILLGKTPLVHVPCPKSCLRLQLTLEGRAPIEDVWAYMWFDEAHYHFPFTGEVPEGMSYVSGGPFVMVLPCLQELGTQATGPYAMDRHEVTNREYKMFVDAGAYTDPKYWKQPFLGKGHPLSWNEAMARFTDRTGRPGPATWEVGSYPEGQAEFPVAGVSWYEAAAYAEWAGRSLPTVFHWNQVAFTPASAWIVPLANLNRGGLLPVNSTRSVNRFGVYDLAGNVREWMWNASGNGVERFILGGGWNDPDYTFEDAVAFPALDRSPTNGFRCIKHLQVDPNLAILQRPVQREMRDFKKEKPVPDAIFAQYLRQFAYDKKPLDARIEKEEETEEGICQTISFNAAYSNERMAAVLILPAEGKPPYQVVVYFPGSGAMYMPSNDSMKGWGIDFLTKSGRAVLFPVYKGTFERGDDLKSDIPSETAAYRDHVVMWGKDLARSLDYLETRKDIDTGRIGFYGYSWGGMMGSMLPAVERRIKASVLYVAGMDLHRAYPEVDQINYVTRVRQPTLILDGELDYLNPRETSQRPLFELLGTPAADKKWLTYPGGHSVPRLEMIKESLAWLDRYLGPVEPGAKP